jgi:hypothetical protein
MAVTARSVPALGASQVGVDIAADIALALVPNASRTVQMTYAVRHAYPCVADRNSLLLGCPFRKPLTSMQNIRHPEKDKTLQVN